MNQAAIDRRAAVFEALFRNGKAYVFHDPASDSERRLVFRTRRVCDVYFPTGQVAACDPADGLSFGCTPFTRTIPKGTYPVILSMTGPSAKPRVAAAKLQLERTRPEKWEMALLPRQNPNRLKKREFFGFGVDAGIAAIGDFETFDLTHTNHDKDEWWRSVIGGWKTCQCWRVPSSKRHNLAICESGYGDGHYPSFFGTTKRGRVLCLVIDFFIVPWEY